jgi:hypothetical protein
MMIRVEIPHKAVHDKFMSTPSNTFHKKKRTYKN